MFSKQKGTIGSIVSILIFVGCCGAMVADFSLWWLPICAVPLLLFFNINYKGQWESEMVDEEAEKEQSAEPYSSTFLFDDLEATPSKEEVKAFKEVEDEHNPPIRFASEPAPQAKKRDSHKMDEEI